jgi:hypothetical protein
MGEEYRAICKDCSQEFGYSQASLLAGSRRGLSRPERCPACRRLHSKESRMIGIPQIPVKATGPRKPDAELKPGRLGKLSHPERPHTKIIKESSYGRPDSLIEFGITDEDIHQLIEAMHSHQVVVVVGPTGSGKSTFLPFRLMSPPEGVAQDIFTRHGQIVVTQPRIPATRSIAKFVAEGLHGCSCGAGFDVGFRHSNAPASDWRNKLVYVTDGTLINWIVSGEIANLSVIMIDEAHERSLNIDLILGLLKKTLPRYPHLKLIIASATINAQLFQNFFGGPEKVALLKFKGLKQHKVEAYFPVYDSKLHNNPQVPLYMANRVEEILLSIAQGERPEGDILGFLAGAGDIEKGADELRKKIEQNPDLRERNILVYPLYSQLLQEDIDLALAKKVETIRERVLRKIRGNNTHLQLMALFLDKKSASEGAEYIQQGLEEEKINDWVVTFITSTEDAISDMNRQVVVTTHGLALEIPNPDKFVKITDRRVILATNLAETSLTVDGVVYVVDSGLIKQSQWVTKHSATELSPIFHSQAGCRQRWGRAGRIRDGEAHMLYTDEQFEDAITFPPYTVPEIQRSSLEQTVLKAKEAGITDLINFDWIEPPPVEELKRAHDMLKNVGALDSEGDLTVYGQELGSFAENVPIADLIIAADQHGCGTEMATLSSLLKVNIKGGLFKWNNSWDFATRYAVEQIIQGLAAPCRDDLELYLKVFSLWFEASNAMERERLKRLFFINSEKFDTEIDPNRERFLEVLTPGKKGEEDRPIHFARLDRLRALLAATLNQAFLFRCSQHNGSMIIQDVHGQDLDIETDIEETSVLATEPPSLFLALRKRISRFSDGSQKMFLGILVRVEDEWLNLQNNPPIQLGHVLAEIVTDRLKQESPGHIRQRLFLDVSYPIGAVYRVLEAENGSQFGEKVQDPEHIIPVFDENKLTRSELEEGKEQDLDGFSGAEDKEDRTISYDPAEEIDVQNGTETKILDYDSWEDAEQAGGLESGMAGSSAHMIQAKAVVQSREVQEAQKLPIDLIWPGETKEGQTRMVRVAGYDFSSSPSQIHVSGLSEATSEAGQTALQSGCWVKVEPLEVLGNPNGESGLLVKETVSGQKFIVGWQDLGFNMRWHLVPDLLVLDTIQMMAEQQESGSNVRLSCLPYYEEHIQPFLKRWKQGQTHNVFGEIIEENKSGYFVKIDGFSGQPADIFNVAYMKKDTRKGAKRYQAGERCQVSLDHKSGQGQEFIDRPPHGLQELIEKEKFRQSICWNPQAQKLYTLEPLNWEFRDRILRLSRDPLFRNSIRKLYRFSNRITVVHGVQNRQTPFLGSGRTEALEYRQTESIIYRPQEMVKGHVSKILTKEVRVVIQSGGIGSIPIRHLAWKRPLDPREVVYPDQLVRARVIDPDSNMVTLSLLDENDPILKDYIKGSIHTALISVVKNSYAIAALEPNLEGIIPVREVSPQYIEKLEEHLHPGQEVRVKIKERAINLSNLEKPLKLVLSIKALCVRYMSIPKGKIGLLIGPQGKTIKEMQRKTGCSIWHDGKNEGRVIIKSGFEEVTSAGVNEVKQLIPEAKEID